MLFRNYTRFLALVHIADAQQALTHLGACCHVYEISSQEMGKTGPFASVLTKRSSLCDTVSLGLETAIDGYSLCVSVGGQVASGMYTGTEDISVPVAFD